eukprot:6179258-Pleurochrysis_carterae.AAC.1
MAALRIIGYMLIDINYRQNYYSWHSTVFHETVRRDEPQRERTRQVHPRPHDEEVYLAVLALEADEWVKARHMLTPFSVAWQSLGRCRDFERR